MKSHTLPPFEHTMSPAQTTLGWVYLALHLFGIPLLLGLWSAYAPEPLDSAMSNAVYYGLGLIFTFSVMLRFLRQGFDTLLDRLPACAFTLLLALALDYLLSGVFTVILLMLETVFTSPNNEAVMELAETNAGLVKGLAVYIAPIVEETLFRGVAFGSLRKKSRALAYVVSIALFSVYHVWQYALIAGDITLLLYALQYIPISFVLAWSYERTQCIWVPIFFHMFINALSFAVLSML